jgi:protein SCO1/2
MLTIENQPRLIMLLLLAWVMAGSSRPTLAQTPAPPPVGIEEHLGRMLPLDLLVYDEEGHLVPLGTMVDRPTIFTFVYYRCPGICSPLLTELSEIVEKMDLEPGKDYRIITLSFDPEETPDLAAGKKESYLSLMDRKIDPGAWRFLTADSGTIARLTDAAGFYFRRDGPNFIHAGALIITSPEGRVTRYINGIRYLPFDVKMALVEASDGKVGPTITKILQFCYAYDPEGRTYTLDITRIGILGTLLLVGIFVLVFIVRPGKRAGKDS